MTATERSRLARYESLVDEGWGCAMGATGVMACARGAFVAWENDLRCSGPAPPGRCGSEKRKGAGAGDRSYQLGLHLSALFLPLQAQTL